MKAGMLKLIVTLICLHSLINAGAQHLIIGKKNTIEAGLNFGPTFLLGDLGGHYGVGTKFVKDVNMPLTKLMKGVFVTIHPNEWLGLRLAAQYSIIEGRDNLITNKGGSEKFRKQRNLDVRSNIWEVYAAAEVFPLMWLKRYDEDYAPVLRPYFFAGVGMFHFNPQGSLTDINGNVHWYYLQPLHTEGQEMPSYPDRKAYKLTQINMPLGAGIKYVVSERISIATEVLYRKTFTDYIDDVSTNYIDASDFDKYLPAADAAIARRIYDKKIKLVTRGIRFNPGEQRGNPKNYDDYFSLLLKVGIRLGSSDENRVGRFASRATRCPLRF